MGWGEEGGSGRGPFLSLGVVNISKPLTMHRPLKHISGGGWVGAGWW